MSTISIIAALAENNAIGKQQQLLCYLPLDLKRFKTLTMGKAIVMGRKTFESLPNGALPKRKNIILSSIHEEGYVDSFVCQSLEEALTLCEKEEEIFIIGGATVYTQAMPIANKLYLTRIHDTFEGADTFFPEVDFSMWKEVEKEFFEADQKHPHSFTFYTYERV
jgi:dihydrofolate reductase